MSRRTIGVTGCRTSGAGPRGAGPRGAGTKAAAFTSDTCVRRLGAYADLHAERSGFQRVFSDLLMRDGPAGVARPAGRVLDIGAGAGLPDALRRFCGTATAYDGLDPSDAVLGHPRLARRWVGFLETLAADASVPAGVYDTAVAYNVVEHVAKPQDFLAAVRRTLRPGGRFWGLTPHARHPFCGISRAVELLGAKRYFAEHQAGVNGYPAYYRCNTPAAVARLAPGAGFDAGRFYLLPCVQWDCYFPRPLRPVATLYDRFIGGRFGAGMLILAFCLQADETQYATDIGQ